MVEINEKQVFAIIQTAKESGALKIGVNEVTKAIERKQAKLVVYGTDVSPAEIVHHLDGLSKEMGITCLKQGSKTELGTLVGIKSTTAIAITDEGNAKKELKDLIDSLSKKEDSKKEDSKEEAKKED